MGLIIVTEIKNNIKGLVLWSIAMALVILMMAVTFDSMSGDISKTMESFPKEMLEMFGMNSIPLGSLEGVYAQGYIMVTLMGSMYAAYTAASMLVKEEDEGSIEYLMSKPFNRIEIYSAKYIALVIIILIFNIVIATSTLGGAVVFGGDNYSKEAINLMAIAPILLHLTFGTLCFGIAPFIRKNRQAVSISIGIVSTFYVLSLIGGLSEKFEGLKNISIFDYVSTNVVAGDKYIEPYHIAIMFAIIIISVILGAVIYKKKDF